MCEDGEEEASEEDAFMIKLKGTEKPSAVFASSFIKASATAVEDDDRVISWGAGCAAASAAPPIDDVDVVVDEADSRCECCFHLLVCMMRHFRHVFSIIVRLESDVITPDLADSCAAAIFRKRQPETAFLHRLQGELELGQCAR